MQSTLLHFFIPFKTLVLYLFLFLGVVALTKCDLIFGWPLQAVNGGLLITCAKCLSMLVIDLQCLAWMLVTEGNLGSYVFANTCLFGVFFWTTLFKACSLGMHLLQELIFYFFLFFSSSI